VTAPRPRVAEPGFIALEGGDARVEVVPEQGGRVRSLHLFGREWLVQGGDAAAPRSGQHPIVGAGWDECAPAAGGGTVPEWVKGAGGRPVPVGGEARLQHPEVQLRTGVDGHQLACTWRGERLPWVLTRTLLVRPDGAVEARYEALTTGSHRLPFLWSAHLLFPLDADTRLRLPEAGRLRVATLTGTKVTGGVLATEGKWPRLTLEGKVRDLSTPWTLPKKTMLTGWLDLGGGRSMIQVGQDEIRLTISTDGASVPHCGVVIDRGGLRSGARRNPFSRGGSPVFALSPSLGAPDRYAEALGDWQSITWLVPGEPRRWTMTIRAGI
jgi:galactose mutarotase-like enzyme